MSRIAPLPSPLELFAEPPAPRDTTRDAGFSTALAAAMEPRRPMPAARMPERVDTPPPAADSAPRADAERAPDAPAKDAATTPAERSTRRSERRPTAATPRDPAAERAPAPATEQDEPGAAAPEITKPVTGERPRQAGGAARLPSDLGPVVAESLPAPAPAGPATVENVAPIIIEALPLPEQAGPATPLPAAPAPPVASLPAPMVPDVEGEVRNLPELFEPNGAGEEAWQPAPHEPALTIGATPNDTVLQAVYAALQRQTPMPAANLPAPAPEAPSASVVPTAANTRSLAGTAPAAPTPASAPATATATGVVLPPIAREAGTPEFRQPITPERGEKGVELAPHEIAGGPAPLPDDVKVLAVQAPAADSAVKAETPVTTPTASAPALAESGTQARNAAPAPERAAPSEPAPAALATTVPTAAATSGDATTGREAGTRGEREQGQGTLTPRKAKAAAAGAAESTWSAAAPAPSAAPARGAVVTETVATPAPRVTGPADEAPLLKGAAQVTLQVGEGDDAAKLRVAVRNGVVQARISAADPMLARELQAGMRELQGTLRKQGFQEARVAVHGVTAEAMTAAVNGALATSAGQGGGDAAQARDRGASSQQEQRSWTEREAPRSEERERRQQQQRSRRDFEQRERR